MENHFRLKLILTFLFLIITINLFALNIKVFSPLNLQLANTSTIISLTPAATQQSTGKFAQEILCPKSCTDLIKEATEATKISIGTPQLIETTPVKTIAATKEYYIPLGSGNTTKSTWDDLIATETIIDPSSYGKIKEAYFTASLRNPTQNGSVEAQLYNVTDKHPVWGSHVIMNGPSSQTINSGKISLDSGNKLYRVQLISAMNFQVYLDNAKIRIIAEQ